MAAAQCSIYRDKEGQIERVLAPNGKESKLFSSLTELTKDKEQALRLWAQAYTPAFKKWFGDWESIEKAKTFKEDIKGYLKESFNVNPEQFLFEIAQQINQENSVSDHLLDTIGEDLFDIATRMFPDTKAGEPFKSNISKVVDENGEPLLVYHGSMEKGIKVFDKSKAGKNTDPWKTNKRIKGLSYFADNKGVAEVLYGGQESTFTDSLKEGQTYSVFLDIKELKENENTFKEKDYLPTDNPNDIIEYRSYVVLEPNQIKSVTNEGKFDSKNNNIYKQESTSTKIESVIGKLQSEKRLGKRIGPSLYEAPIDPTDSNPVDQERRAYEIAQRINLDSGKEIVNAAVLPDGSLGILVNDKQEGIVSSLDASDVQKYKKFLMENLYTDKDEPTTTELINNSAKLAKDLGRQDLVNMARLLYKYLPKNTALSTRVIDTMPNELSDKTKAYYNRVSNRITFSRDKIGVNTLEFEATVVLHEHFHALTFQPWFKQEQKIPLDENERVFKGVVETYYNYFKSLQGAATKDHRFSDAEEFLIASLTDTNFKDHLKEISGNQTKENPFIRFMKDLLRGFLKLFGMKIDNGAIDQIDPSKFEQNMFDALSSYLDKMDKIELYNGLKEDGRNYGLSFTLTAEGDYETERQKTKQKFTPELKEQVKKVIEKSLLSIKSFGSTIRNRLPETQEGFQAIFRQLKKLEDPEYNLDQIDFFFDFTSEISSIMNMADDKITKLQTDQTINDPDFKLKEYESIMYAIRNFDSIISDIQAVKVKMENSGMQNAVKEINNIFDKRARIESIYSMGVFPLVTSKLVDILTPSSKKAIEIANANLDRLNQSLVIATRNNVTARVNQLQKQIKTEQENINKQFTLNSDKVESWLRGEMGDSNVYSTWLEAGVSNSNPIVSSLSKYIRDNVGQIAPKVLDLQNSLQSEIEQYHKNANKSINNINEFNEPLIQTHKEINGKDDKGNYTHRDVISLLNPFNGGHIVELQTFKRKLTDLYTEKREIENDPNMDEKKLAPVIANINEIKKARQDFLKDYMEQKYSPEVHAALDMLYDDLGGYSAWDYMGAVLGRMEDLEVSIDQETDESRLADLYNQLDDQNFELRRLTSLYEKSPDSREYKVAEQLKKRNALLAQYSNFVLTDKGNQHFLAERARMKRKLDNKEITPQRYERWLEDNTITELTTKYWEEKRAILQGLNEVATKLGAKSDQNEELKKLYSDIEDVVKAYRDKSGIINGQEMSEKELLDTKNIEQKVEDIKDNIANIMGLTKLERMELSNLYDQLNEITDKIISTSDPLKGQILDQEQNRVNARITQIESKKKKLNKDLLKEYFNLMKELMKLDESKETKYYWDELTEQTEKAKWAVDISKMPSKFFAAGNTYQKSGDNWFEVNSKGSTPRDNSHVEDVYRKKEGEISLASSKWWTDNHIIRIKYVPNDSYDPSNPYSSNGQLEQVEEPTFPWRQTRPREPKYISDNQPSIKYRKRIIKDNYINSNYREDVSGNIQPKITGAKDDRFVNKNYTRLRNSNNPTDKATFKYLTYLTDTYLKAQESIPQPKRKGYELPSIRKSTIERFFSQPISATTQEQFGRLGNMLRLWNDDISTNEQDKDILFGYNDDFTGVVPMKFLGEIDSKDQSIDLSKVILAFTIESMKRDQLVKSLPLTNAIKDIVNNPDFRPVKTKNGKIETIKRKFLPKGTELAKRASISNTALQVNEIIKSEIYGESMKEVQGAKFVNSTLHLGAKLMLGFNFISSVQNYANAFTQSIMETESNISGNFTPKNYFDAQKIYYGHITSLTADLGKYGNKSYINQFFDYFGGINFKLYSKNNRTLAGGKLTEFLNDLSVPNTITEHMLNYHMGIAIALNYRVKAKVDGTETNIPIFEAFTLKDRKLIVKPGVNVTETDRKEMIARLNSSARRINGEYGDKILADKYVLGRLALFMNRYVIPFVAKRYGARKFDIQDGIREEGYWRLFGKTLLKDLKSKSVPILMGWKYYTREEKNAIVRSMTEFGFTVALFLLLNSLGAGGDDKHLKDNSLLVNNLIYALKGIQQQNEAFMPVPGVGFDDLLRKIQNPFPILGKVKNLVAIIQDGSHTLYYEMGLPGVEKNDIMYSKESGWHKPGDLKVMADLQKLMGLPQHVMQYMYPEQAIKNLDAFSRIK